MAKDDAIQPSVFGFIGNTSSDIISDVDTPGGSVNPFLAGGALNVGDAVYLSDTGTVNKSNTPANYQKFAGIVVGGKQTSFECITRRNDVGIAAAATGEIVLVQYTGRALCVADAAVAKNALVTQGATTAGRLDDSASATQGQIIGTSIEAAGAAAGIFLVLLGHR